MSEASQDRDAPRVELAETAALAPIPAQGDARLGDRVVATLTKTSVEHAENGGLSRQADGVRASVRAEEADYIARNRAAWERWAPAYANSGRAAWRQQELRLGIWRIPESGLGVFDGLRRGADVIELGCGTAVVSAWLARHGANPVAIDFVPTQLRTAQTLQREVGLPFPLVCANAERLEFDDARFDLAISEYGASLWCDPRRWLPEAARLLRPGGRLIFFTNGALLLACTPNDGGPAGDQLVRHYFSGERVEFPGEDAVEFHPTHGDWVRLLRANGFALEDLIEVQPPPQAKAARFEFASIEWARKWPSEEIWVARKEE